MIFSEFPVHLESTVDTNLVFRHKRKFEVFKDICSQSRLSVSFL